MVDAARGWRAVAGVALGLALAAPAWAGDRSKDGSFEFVPRVPDNVLNADANVRPDRYKAVRVDWQAMLRSLEAAPMEDTPAAANPLTVELPMPDGAFERFAVVEAPVMAPALAAKFPEIRTYLGQGIDTPAATVRFDHTPHGFHAQILAPGGAVYIDPVTRGDTEYVASYSKNDYNRRTGWHCLTDTQPAPTPAQGSFSPRAIVTRKTFRTAVTCTGEYATFHGGTVPLAQAAITTAINRITGIYETELAVRLTLVAGNDQLIFLNRITDPFTNSNAGQDAAASHLAIVGALGAEGFDIGHCFGTDGSGIAGGIGIVCNNNSKGAGFSGVSPPINDPFTVDYVSHEMGHQFGARHTFNNCGGGPGDQVQYAFEPGSGVTIMGYAGICGSNDLDPHSIPAFHSGSLELIQAFLGSATCAQSTATTNNTPTVSAGTSFTIPKGTPFILTGTGSDPDADTVTYSWEQRDTGAPVALPLIDNGSSPIMRPFMHTPDPKRIIPRLGELLDNASVPGEILPTTTRALHFILVARDNHAGGGGRASSTVTINVNSTAGPFQVTSPNTQALIWSGVQTVRWNVARTNNAPISAQTVRIKLSTDGGLTFPVTLADSVPNNGAATVVLPITPTSEARIKVESTNNIFFDIGDYDFTIDLPPVSASLQATADVVINDAAINGNNNHAIDPGENRISLTIPALNGGQTTAVGAVGTLASLTPTVQIVTATATYPDIAYGQTRGNTAPYIIAVSPLHACGTPINLRLTFNSPQGGGSTDFLLPTGRPGGPGVPRTFSYTGPPVSIPNNAITGITIPFNVTDVPGRITSCKFRIDGTSCSDVAGSSTVGLSHTFVGDLALTLISPSGSSVVLAERPGDVANGGNNFCQTLFDDAATNLIQNILPTGAPYTGSFKPRDQLSTFNGELANGQWSLFVQDLGVDDIGAVRAFSLIVGGEDNRVCSPPRVTCVADVDDGSGTGQPDGGVTIDDLLFYIAIFETGDIRADVDDGSGTGHPDGGVTIDDLLFFILHFTNGC